LDRGIRHLHIAREDYRREMMMMDHQNADHQPATSENPWFHRYLSSIRNEFAGE
jgi:hypothetical protein